VFTTVTGFGGCTALTAPDVIASLPATVTKIGENAFKGCSFTSVILPGSITEVGMIPAGVPVKILRGTVEVTPEISGSSFTATVESRANINVTAYNKYPPA
jgi:hypothetical protein